MSLKGVRIYRSTTKTGKNWHVFRVAEVSPRIGDLFCVLNEACHRIERRATDAHCGKFARRFIFCKS